MVVLLLIGVAWGLYAVGKNEEKNEQPIQANIIQKTPEIFPMRNWSIDEPEILAKSAILIYSNQKDNILFQRDTSQILPIASLTKIMTAIIVLENYNPEEIIKVSAQSVKVNGDTGGLIADEELTVKNLLYIMLIESSNDAAMALATDNPRMSYNEFITLMNSKAKELGLENTSFIDPAGLSPENKSNVAEMAKLTKYALDFPIILDILKTPQSSIYSTDRKFIHNLTSTNKLLGKIPQLIGGKTGFTDEAGGCMITISNIYGERVKSNNYLITVVLDSDQREGDTEKLINWAQEAWLWK